MAGLDVVTLHHMDPKAIRKMADDHGVPIVCHTFHADLNHADAAERAKGVEEVKAGLEAAVILGAPVAMIPPVNRSDADRETARRQFIEGFKEVVPLARDAGVALTVENFPGNNSPFVVSDDVLQAVHGAPGMKLTFDNGNVAAGEDPATSFTRCAEHVVHAHFKDWAIRDDPADGFRRMLDGRYWKPALIGEGDIDHAACLAAMTAAGYAGCINIEYEGNTYTPEEAVRRAVDYLRGLAG
jgi:sugar phosphate isomerase/epimerase